MNSPGQDVPSGRALWALLWRAVVFFPLGVLLAALPFVVLFAGTELAGWAVAFSFRHEWWHAAACLSGLPVVVFVWRAYARWSAPAGTGGGGYVV